MTAKEFLYKYLNANSPVGAEMEGQKIWLDYLKSDLDEHIVDAYGSVIGIINPNQPYTVVIEAHADEISWFVNHITDDGYIYVVRNGGSDFAITPSMRVHLHTEKGKVNGVFGFPAIHVRNSEKDDVKPEQKNMFIDIGAKNKAEVEELGVHVGVIATFVDGLMELNDKYYVGRALDNRMGGYMIAQVVKKLKENNIKLPYTLCVVNSVQEEVGLRGAEMVAKRLNPDVAIVTDVCHDTYSPLGYNKIKDGAIKAGEGAVLTYSPAVQTKLRDEFIRIAKDKKIPFQRLASSRSTGTDTDAFAYQSNGKTSAMLVSLPLKYMHTTVETAHKEDVESCINLIYEYLVQLESGRDYRYFA